MREIKFRAWDKEDQTMKRVTMLDFPEWSVCIQNGEEFYEVGDRNSFKNEETDRCILMQYTGLKDKNGKEIYEGDIVEFTVSRIEANRVVWRDSCWFLLNPRNNGYRLYKGISDNIEIIGNIYENPELIT